MDLGNGATCSRTNGNETGVATGKFQLGPLAAAMSRCNLLITNDSGPMHVAISQMCQLWRFYGPSNPFFYGPYQAHAIVLETMDSL